MNVQTQIDKTSPGATEHFDVLIVGRRHLRRRRGLSPHHAMPGNDASSCWKPRRPSAAPGAPTAIPASAPTATCTPSAIASSRGRRPPIATAAEILQLHGRRDRGERSRPTHPLSHTHHLGALVERGRISGPSRPTRTDTGETASLHHQLPLDVPGLLPPHRGLHAGVEGHGEVQGPDRPSADLA